LIDNITYRASETIKHVTLIEEKVVESRTFIPHIIEIEKIVEKIVPVEIIIERIVEVPLIIEKVVDREV
jgi:hypothetical protein